MPVVVAEKGSTRVICQTLYRARGRERERERERECAPAGGSAAFMDR